MRIETRKLLPAFLVLLIMIPVFGKAGSQSSEKDSVLYPYDNSLGQKMRWTGAYARFSVDAPKDVFGFTIHVSPYNSEDEKGLEVVIRANGEVIDILHFFEATEEELVYAMPVGGSKLDLELEVSRTFQPEHMGAANSYSDLGVAISEVHFFDELPKGGIGFSGSDISTEGPAWSQEHPITFLWTRARASWVPACPVGNWLAFYIACGHPDVSDKPVTVKLLGDGKELRRWVVQNADWMPVLLKPEEARGLRHLTLQSDRVFNERLQYPGGDPRDLSIALTPMEYVASPPKEAMGFYPWEQSTEILGQEQKYRWTAGLAVAPLGKKRGKFLLLGLMAGEPDLGENPLEVVLRPEKGVDRKILLKDSMWHSVSFPVAELGDSSFMTFEVSRTWCPKAVGNGVDARNLGVAVTSLDYADQEKKTDWEGFYNWEKTPEGFVVEGAGADIPYRWSSARGVIRGQFNVGDWLFIMCAHPDIEQNPVHVRISGDGKLITEETPADNLFHRVLLRAHELADPKEITVEVDRTWNPKKLGISNDDRDLGVAVAIVPAENEN